MRIPLIAPALLAAAALAACCAPAAAGAVPTYEYTPCGTDLDWSYTPSSYFLRETECDGFWSLGTSLYVLEPEPASTWMGLRAGDVDSVRVMAWGRDRSDEGLHEYFAVCNGPKFPDDCGTPVTGMTGQPFKHPEVLTRENGGVPPGADRLMLYSDCTTASFSTPCYPSDNDPRFSEIRVVQEDADPPLMGEFPLPQDKWLNSVDGAAVSVSDAKSGVAKLSAYNQVWNLKSDVDVCGSGQIEFGCPVSADVQPSLVEVHSGRNRFTLTATDAAGNSVMRPVSFLFDNTAPAVPADVNLDGTWVVGDHATLRWTNYPESVPTDKASGVAKATVDIFPSSGWDYAEYPKTFSGVGIDSIPLDLPAEESWSGTITLTDAAGNASPPKSFSFESEANGPSAPSIPPYAPAGIDDASAGVHLYWYGVAGSRSGLCGYRGWVGKGAPPNLAADPSTTLPGGAAQQWQITPSGLLNLQDGANTVALAAVDCAGEVSATSTGTLRIDRVAPVARLDATGPWLPAGQPIAVDAEDVGAANAQTGIKNVWYRVDAGAKTVLAVDHATIPPLSAGIHAVQFGAVDGAGNPSPDATRNVGVDPDAPDVSIAAVEGDPGAFAADVRDPLSGVVEAWSELAPAGGAPERIGDRLLFAQGRTERLALAMRLPGSLPDGDYVLQVFARDAAGNVQSSAARTIHVPLRPPARVSAAIASASRPEAAKPAITLDAGAPAVLSGRLLDAAGAAISGAPLNVYAKRDAGGGRRLLGSATTTADGLYRFPLGTDVSRELSVSFAGDAVRGPAGASVRENVRAGVSLSLSSSRVRRGSLLAAYGRVRLLSASVPAGGLPVRLNYCSRSGCRRFGYSGRTDSEGGYRIQFGTRGYARGTYRLHAVVERLAGWPFSDGESKTVKVVIR